MEYSGFKVPGIVSPEENIEDFAKLYGNDSLGMMMLSSTLGNSYGLSDKSNSPRYGVQTPHGSRAMRHGGHYNTLPAMDRYSHQQEDYAFPRGVQCSRSLRHGGYNDRYQRVNHQPERQFRIGEQQNQYIFPYTERYAWL